MLPTVSPESIRKIFESAFIQHEAASKGVGIIYIDEFSIILVNINSEVGVEEARRVT